MRGHMARWSMVSGHAWAHGMMVNGEWACVDTGLMVNGEWACVDTWPDGQW